jgi:hypothetical protein
MYDESKHVCGVRFYTEVTTYRDVCRGTYYWREMWSISSAGSARSGGSATSSADPRARETQSLRKLLTDLVRYDKVVN